MTAEEFTSKAAGELVKNLDGHWAFIPHPLPPKIELTTRMFRTVSHATLSLGKLSGLGRRLPNPQRLVRMFLRREAELSSRIENTFARIQTMVLFEQLADVEQHTPDVLEVTNNFRTLEFAISSAEHRSLNGSLIKEMHAILLRGVRGHDKTPGKFRTVQAHIGRTANIDEARFVPAPPHAIDLCMADLERYLARPDDLPPLVRAALVHYQFETIHPFADGNGRVGRVLLLVQMIKEGLLPAPLLNPSAQLERHRQAYYDGLLAVSQQGDWNAWIEFFLSSLAEEAEDACRRIEAFELKREHFHQIVRTPRASTLLPVLVDELFADPTITNTKVRSLLGVSVPAAQSMLDRLEELQIIREVTGQRRNRVYLAQPVVDLFSDTPHGAG